jgi:hypothetical protein
VDGNGFDGLDAERLLNLWQMSATITRKEGGYEPRRLFRRNWSTRARASGFCQ